jgi:hypothetical protein
VMVMLPNFEASEEAGTASHGPSFSIRYSVLISQQNGDVCH